MYFRAILDPHAWSDFSAGNAEASLAREDVEVSLPICLEIADIAPESVCLVAVHRLAGLKQHWEEVLAEVELLAAFELPEDSGLEHAYSSIHHVVEDLSPARLLETFERAALVQYHDPVFEGVGTRVSTIVARDPAGVLYGGSQVHVSHGIAADHQEGVIEKSLCASYAAGAPNGSPSTNTGCECRTASASEVILDYFGRTAVLLERHVFHDSRGGSAGAP